MSETVTRAVRLLSLSVLAAATAVVASRAAGAEDAMAAEQVESVLDPRSGISLPQNRRVERLMQQLPQLIEQGQFTEVTRFLGELLAGAPGGSQPEEDAFLPAENSSLRFRTLKSEVHHLLRSLPEEGRSWYERQFGTRARNALDEVLQTGQVERLPNIVRDFFHTEAGQDAAWLLAQRHMDHGEPMAAARLLERLREVPRARQRLEPALSVRLVSAWHDAGRPDLLEPALQRLRSSLPDAELLVGGKAVSLSELKLSSHLAQLSAQQETESHHVSSRDWLLFRGSADGNVRSAGGMPMLSHRLSHRWRVRTSTYETLLESAKKLGDTYQNKGVAVVPSLQPLAVGDTIVMRGLHYVEGIDFRSGKRIWLLRGHVGQRDPFAPLIDSAGSQSSSQLIEALEQRIWDDRAYGAMTSDGRRLYVLQGLQPVDSAPVQTFFGRNPAFNVDSTGAFDTAQGHLVAVDLRAQGKRLWEVGGAASEVEELAGASILGAPLPLDGRLYALAENKGSIRLVVLDSASGKLLWSQQLVNVERSLNLSSQRRLTGATPSYGSGILVCPISAGAVVAVDLTDRSLLWAYTYPTEQDDGFRRSRFRHYGSRDERSNDAWVSSDVAIVGDRVVLTPIDSDSVICLDLLTGKEIWQQDRDEMLYLACIHPAPHGAESSQPDALPAEFPPQRVVLVGVHEVKLLDLESGSAEGLPAVRLPEGALPSGRGYYSQHYYYLPLTSAEVVKIDLNTGQIVQRVGSQSGRVPGNLVCHQGQILSQRADALEVFYQVEALDRRVTEALAANPKDAEALARKGELALHRGELNQAVESLRLAFNADPDPLTRELLIESLLLGLEKDFPANRDSATELADLIDQPDQKAKLLRLMAGGLQAAGEIMPAFENYQKLVELTSREPLEMARVSEGHFVRSDHRILGQMMALRAQADQQDREHIDAAISARIEALLAAPVDPNLPAHRRDLQLRWWSHFDELSIAETLRQALVDAAMEDQQWLAGELWLQKLQRCGDPSRRAAAVAKTAALLREEGDPADAAIYYRRLQQQFADVEVLPGKTGRALVEQLPADGSIRMRIKPADWPVGQVTHEVDKPPVTAQRYSLVTMTGDPGPFFRGKAVILDQATSAVIVRDARGNDIRKITLNRNLDRRPMQLTRLDSCVAAGHLLVANLGSRIVAIDTLDPDGQVLWSSDLSTQLHNLRAGVQASERRVNRPGRIARYRGIYDQYGAVGELGPITARGVTYLAADQLRCVDPWTGELLWKRTDLPRECELFGDDQYLFVVPQDDQPTVVLRQADGTIVGRRDLPPQHQRVAELGRRVLTWSSQGKNWHLSMIDALAGEELWGRQYGTGSKVFCLDHQVVAVMQRDGSFTVLSLPDGEPMLELQLEPEPQLVAIYLLPTTEGYILITNRPSSDADGREIAAAPSGDFDNPLVTGRIYALDRDGDRPRWVAAIDRQALWLRPPPDVPVITLTRRVAERKSQSPRDSLWCLDKQTGRLVARKTDLSRIREVRSYCDPESRTAVVSLGSLEVELKYTDTPVPPEPPPYEVAERRSQGVGILQALPRALFRAIETTPSPEDD